MNERRRLHPEMERLEGIALLSATGVAFHHATSALVHSHVTATSQPAAIHGSVSGTYTAQTASDGSRSYTFHGAGIVSPFGSVSFACSTTVPLALSGAASATEPPAAAAQATGTVTLSNASGSVTLSITGPAADMAARHPDVFRYAITSATGAFQGATAAGYLDFALSPASSGPSEQGSFEVTFLRSGSPPPP